MLAECSQNVVRMQSECSQNAVRIKVGNAVADYAVSCGYAHMRLRLRLYAHIFFKMRKSAY